MTDDDFGPHEPTPQAWLRLDLGQTIAGLDPARSAWVVRPMPARGMTHVLTQRVIRLLLPVAARPRSSA